MGTFDLHEILENDDKKITRKELVNLIDSMRADCLNKMYELSDKDLSLSTYRFYAGEENAFYIALQLLSHLEENKNGQ